MRRFERDHIAEVLRRAASKEEAAKRLGIGLSSLYRKMDELDIDTGTARRRRKVEVDSQG